MTQHATSARAFAHRPSATSRPPADAIALLSQARGLLTEAEHADSPDERFRSAHLAALRTAAAVFAARGRPAGMRRRLVSAWVLLSSTMPQLHEWAALFAAGAATRAAVEAGAHNAVSARQADDQLRAATEFLHVVEESLGLLSPVLAG